ncbi:MAG TPA: gamma carbonic anhydrase family protein [Bacillota bacterium]|jgi:carbonic anhydrase/acetyltransferase-like protein (isoleucine patch superfamily)
MSAAGRSDPLKAFGGKTPRVHPTAFIAEGAQIIGDVTIGEQAGVWYNAVVRGDLAPITIGANSNIQDNAVLHTVRGGPIVIGVNTTIGHGAILHACTIGDGAMVGMAAVVLDRAVVEDGAIVGACALVGEGKTVAARTLNVGVPAKPVKELGPESDERLRGLAGRYADLAAEHKKEQGD